MADPDVVEPDLRALLLRDQLEVSGGGLRDLARAVFFSGGDVHLGEIGEQPGLVTRPCPSRRPGIGVAPDLAPGDA